MDSDLWYLGLLFICFIFSAVFAAAETALTSVPETFIRQIIDKKSGLIKPFKLWLERPNRVLTAIIVGNNLVNTLAAVVATVYAQKLFDQYVISISTGCVTLALLILGEITPKTFARHNASSVVRPLLYAIYPLYFVLFPAVYLLSHFAVFLVDILGGRTRRTGPVATEEDIEYLIQMSHEEGVFKQEQGKMLQSVIRFRDTSVKEVMVPRIDLCSIDVKTDFRELMARINQYGYTRWPVYEDDVDHVIGILYVKDLIHFLIKGGEKFELKKNVRKAIFIPESMKLDAVLKELQKQKVHLAIVVDEYGGTSGIVSLEDILEEIVGEIRDEYDKEEEEETIRKIGENHFLVDGRTGISDLQKRTEIEIPTDEGYDSVGGFLIARLGKIPEKNCEIYDKGFVFKVVDVEEKRINKVEIFPCDSQEENETLC